MEFAPPNSEMFVPLIKLKQNAYKQFSDVFFQFFCNPLAPNKNTEYGPRYFA